jgi:hypothetical protein
MPEWWTYGLSDFLMFSPRTYYRLLQRYNGSVWPAHVLTLCLGVMILGLLRSSSLRSGRIISGIMTLLWMCIAVFLWSRYATINWAVGYITPLFAVEVLLLAWLGVAKARLDYRLSRDAPGALGAALLIFSLGGYPLLASLSGRPWQQGEVFGIAPDPTALGTMGLTILVESYPGWRLAVVPILWLLFSGATLLAMDSTEAYLLLPGAVLGSTALVWQARRTSSARRV